MAVEVPLTRGAVALIDAADAERVLSRKWRLLGPLGCFYAGTSWREGGRHLTVMLHRFLMEPPAGFVVDHIDGDGLNNQRANLRVVTQGENLLNRSRASRRSQTGVLNVYPFRSRFHASVRVGGEVNYLGSFETVKDAAAAVRAFREARGILSPRLAEVTA